MSLCKKLCFTVTVYQLSPKLLNKLLFILSALRHLYSVSVILNITFLNKQVTLVDNII